MTIASNPKTARKKSARALPISKAIENKIIAGIEGGVRMVDILASVQHMQYAPKSISSLYNVYGHIIKTKQAELKGLVGKRVIDHALTGKMEDKSTQWAAELYLRSRGDWSPTSTNIEVEQDIDPDLDENAADKLLAMLGKNFTPDSDDDDEETSLEE